MLPLLLAPALAASPPARLLLVGDSGLDTTVARRVAEAVEAEAAAPGHTIHVLAMGDLYYDSVPTTPDCAAQVAARYRLFYEGVPAAKVLGVVGNHDVANPDHKGFSAAARACTAAAYEALGWRLPDSGVVKLDAAGVKIDLALVDAGWLAPDGAHQGATPPALKLRKNADWVLYANHYTWRTSTGKCKEADNTWAWLGRPPMDLWLNGHAHHLEAIPVEGALAVTSGASMQLRPLSTCEGVTGSLFTYVKGATEQGGYVRLDIESKTSARLTPVLCDVGGACVDQPAILCMRSDGGRGVECGAVDLAATSAAAPSP